jgi:hypothetical protein
VVAVEHIQPRQGADSSEVVAVASGATAASSGVCEPPRAAPAVDAVAALHARRLVQEEEEGPDIEGEEVELPREPAAMPAALASAAAQCELSRELQQLGLRAPRGAPRHGAAAAGLLAAPPLVSHVVRSLDIAVHVLDEPV